MQEKMPSFGILYDFLEVKGGAEEVFFTILDLFPGSMGMVAFANIEIFDAEYLRKYKIAELSKHPSGAVIKSLKGMYQFYTSRATLDSEYLLYSGNNTILFRPRCSGKPQPRIYYCHTPPRHLYDLYDFWMKKLPFYLKPLFLLSMPLFRFIYKNGLRKFDLVLANSRHTQEKLTKYLSQKSEVVYPPCDISSFYGGRSKDYYLSSSRIEPYKRVRLVVEAFAKMPDKKLIVASGGSELDSLQAEFSLCENIEFTGWLDRADLTRLVSGCICSIYIPIEEDFGMSPVESMAAGKPVIGVSEGGVKETVEHLSTGYLLPEQPGIDDLIEAVMEMDDNRCRQMAAACREKANQFSKEAFRQRLVEAISLLDL